MPLLDLRFGELYSPQEFVRSTEVLAEIAGQYASLPEEEAVYQLWDFVCREIKYPKTASDRHVISAYELSPVAFIGTRFEFKESSNDFAQFPNETLAWGIGDCLDTSNLLAAIALNFVPPDKLYVVVGEVINGVGHAWVEYYHPINNRKAKILETTLRQAPNGGSKGIRGASFRDYSEYDRYWRYSTDVLEGEIVMPPKGNEIAKLKAIQTLWGVPVKGL